MRFLKKNHVVILAVLFLGCLLHPPATIVAAGCYGLSLAFDFFKDKQSSNAKKNLIRLLVLSPFYIATTLYVVHRPEHIGQMVNRTQAESLPSFENPGGRFAFFTTSKHRG